MPHVHTAWARVQKAGLAAGWNTAERVAYKLRSARSVTSVLCDWRNVPPPLRRSPVDMNDG
jgi:hypothetical protein